MTETRKLTDLNGQSFYPLTNTESVIGSDGESIDAILGQVPINTQAITEESERAKASEGSISSALSGEVARATQRENAIEQRLGNYILSSEKGSNNGVATLNGGRKVWNDQLGFAYRGEWQTSQDIDATDIEPGMYFLKGNVSWAEVLSGDSANGVLVQYPDNYHTQQLIVGRSANHPSGEQVETYTRRYLSGAKRWTAWYKAAGGGGTPDDIYVVHIRPDGSTFTLVEPVQEVFAARDARKTLIGIVEGVRMGGVLNYLLGNDGVNMIPLACAHWLNAQIMAYDVYTIYDGNGRIVKESIAFDLGKMTDDEAEAGNLTTARTIAPSTLKQAILYHTSDLVNGGAYNSTSKKIELLHGSTVVAEIDTEPYDDTAVRELISSNADAISAEAARAQGVEQGLRTDITEQIGIIQTKIEEMNVAKGATIAATSAAQTATQDTVAATQSANTAAQNANVATQATQNAIAQAERVNAVLDPETNVVTITDKDGNENSVDLTNKTDVTLSGSTVIITDRVGNESEIDLLDATNERVYINISTNKPNMSVANITVNVYYNKPNPLPNGATPDVQVTTNENGQCYVDVPNDYHYRLVFPTLQGCDPITDVTHIAHASQRIIDVEYEETITPPSPVIVGEYCTVLVQYKEGNSFTKMQGIEVIITYDNTPITCVTNVDGEANTVIPFGKVYTVKLPMLDGKYARRGYTQTYTATMSRRVIAESYYPIDSGVFIVCQDGSEYNFTAFKEARENRVVTNDDAKMIKIVSENLVNIIDPDYPDDDSKRKSGVFGVDIDFIRNTNLNNIKKQWCTINREFKSIPLNGSAATSKYFYDGLTATELVLEEARQGNYKWYVPDIGQTADDATDYATALAAAEDAGLTSEALVAIPVSDDDKFSVPAFVYTYSKVVTLDDGIIHQGFLGSYGQWSTLQANLDEVNDILVDVRPEGTYAFGNYLTVQKWTSTQCGASNAYSWTAGASNYTKTSSFVAVPFFAF